LAVPPFAGNVTISPISLQASEDEPARRSVRLRTSDA